MTFKDLQNKIGPQTETDWRQAKGGGWIHKSAKVDNEANVMEQSIVWGVVSGNARVFGNAQVFGNAWVYGNAWVSGDAWVKPVLFVLDSRGHGCTNCKHGWLKIGCEEHTFKDWKQRFSAIARKHKLTKAENQEYKAIVNLFCVAGVKEWD